MRISANKIVLMFSVAAVLIGAAVLITWFVFGANLGKDVKRMVQVMSELDTVVVETELTKRNVNNIPIFPIPKENATIRFAGKSIMNVSDLSNVKHSSVFRALGGIEGAELRGQAMDSGTELYLLFETAPNYGDVDLRSFTNEWIKVPDGFSFAPLIGKESLKKLTQEDINKLIGLLQEIDMVDVKRTDLTEIINGDVTIRYEFSPNIEGMTTFLSSLWEIRHEQNIDAVSYNDLVDKISKISEAKGFMWLGKKTFLLHRLVMETEDLKLKIEFSDFNLPIDILPPQDNTVPIEQTLQALGFNPASLPSAQKGSTTVIKDSENLNSLPASSGEKDNDLDEDGLANSLENFYGTDPYNPDTDGDGVSDGDEVSKGRNPKGKGSLFSFGL